MCGRETRGADGSRSRRLRHLRSRCERDAVDRPVAGFDLRGRQRRRFGRGPHAGQKVLSVQGARPRETDLKQSLRADTDGSSVHAAVRCGADDRQEVEQLCRYITRPVLANERVQTNAAGQVLLKLKTLSRDGMTHLVMSPLEFMQRLAVLVTSPRLHLIRFHAILAPNAKLRALVVPGG